MTRGPGKSSLQLPVAGRRIDPPVSFRQNHTEGSQRSGWCAVQLLGADRGGEGPAARSCTQSTAGGGPIMDGGPRAVRETAVMETQEKRKGLRENRAVSTLPGL